MSLRDTSIPLALDSGSICTVRLAGETDWEGFRRHARSLLLAGVPAERVVWVTSQAPAGELIPMPPATTSVAPRVPKRFIELAESVILHHDPGRFVLLYRLLERLQREPALRSDPLDRDVLQARQMARAVRRELHKMKAFVRFRPLHRDGEAPLHVAWFEPAHHVVEAVAPFFVQRFAQMHWAILTPMRSAHWNGSQLVFGAGASREQAPPADAGEALWLTYYRHIFNPARLKLDAMRREMPRRYWRNLPEASLIGELAASASQRSGRMIETPATLPRHGSQAWRIAGREPRTGPSNAAAHDMEDPKNLPADDVQALAQLHDMAERCRDCPIGEHATQVVWGEGAVPARLMVVGEQPGDQEDLQGRPFVGPAGRLLDRAFAELGWSRDELYVTNAVKHFKFELRGKRRIHKTPGQREMLICLQWLRREVDHVRPKAALALGGTAARALLGRAVSVNRERGVWLPSPFGIPVLVTLHPSALLRLLAQDREAAYREWLEDLRRAL
ncbi:MAG: UdgX family uracil-DNA binding protein [Burkholderiales bacterium]|nr:UdgX family uracil-DNA binding protein [Burkholderiales bacterium]